MACFAGAVFPPMFGKISLFRVRPAANRACEVRFPSFYAGVFRSALRLIIVREHFGGRHAVNRIVIVFSRRRFHCKNGDFARFQCVRYALRVEKRIRCFRPVAAVHAVFIAVRVFHGVPANRFAIFHGYIGHSKFLGGFVHRFHDALRRHRAVRNAEKIASRFMQRNGQSVISAPFRSETFRKLIGKFHFPVRKLSAENHFRCQRNVAARRRGKLPGVQAYIIIAADNVHAACGCGFARRYVDKRSAVGNPRKHTVFVDSRHRFVGSRIGVRIRSGRRKLIRFAYVHGNFLVRKGNALRVFRFAAVSARARSDCGAAYER